ncbi:MAG TPA: rod shape-determining protein MreC [Gemmatimonadales bacterium]|jgi:rod shape-determining protein MreC|nr:rod shape-determining protein MreC [Gemmatimonadales bacterium]
MLVPSDRSFSRRDTILFLVCVGLSLAALFAPTRMTLGLAQTLRDTLLFPLVWLNELAEEGRTSRARLRAITAERDSAAYIAQGLPALAVENERLRALLGLSQRIRARYVPAEVLHQAQATDSRMLLLGAGSEAGIAPFDPVVAPEGLIGVVASAGRNVSTAMTWAHPEFRASAFTDSGAAVGIVAASPAAGPSEPFLEFRGVSYRDSIPGGTLVLSSGLGGVYPKGIPIGRVVGVVREQAGWERVYRVRPAANPGTATHVLVLTAPRAVALGDAFHADTGGQSSVTTGAQVPPTAPPPPGDSTQ